jgi:HAD superfamily hydrolase (TIGR01549 family)
MTPPVVLDVDGTLVDSNFQHALTWHRAFARHGRSIPAWRTHRAIGMGGDQLVRALCGDAVEDDLGEDIRAAEKALYMAVIDEVQPFEGARALMEDLKRAGRRVVLASSAKPDEINHYLDLLDARGIVDAWTSAGDVERTKPEPDLVESALEKIGGGDAVMVGDSTWDCRAADNAGVVSIAVLTGGFSEQELSEAGAVTVFESIEDLRQRVSASPLG